MKFNKEVFCTLQVEGIHNWKDCPFDEVAYLRDSHRHVFWIKAYKEVTHSDRDVEFIMLKHKIEQYLRSKYRNTFLKLCVFRSMSCEMIAEELITAFDLSRCEVSEDGENGAIVTPVSDSVTFPTPGFFVASPTAIDFNPLATTFPEPIVKTPSDIYKTEVIFDPNATPECSICGNPVNPGCNTC